MKDMALASSPVQAPGLKPKAKILVAIHGIGDQIGYATAQAVASQVGSYYDIAAPIPLGRFYRTNVGKQPQEVQPAPVLMTPPDDPIEFSDIGFGEVYWAEIPRGVVRKGHILEETKKWARTVSGRLAWRAAQSGSPIPTSELVRLTTVLDELIETVAVLERLMFVFEKAGLLKFNLNALLTDFLGDVQIVADFESYRGEILKAFDKVMNEALSLRNNEVELYLVAHSEGTVLTFLAVLSALADPDAHPWIREVRGIMTIGSPIETHHLLWPGLWRDLRPKTSPQGRQPATIPWHNYYDYGDPIAYALDETSRWLHDTGFDQHLALTEKGFGRSILPGKAHVDYWNDCELFSHFIKNVVRPSTECPRPAPEPGTRWWAVAISYIVPQVLVAALVGLATFFLYRPVAVAVTNGALRPLTVARDVTGIALLLLGVTAAARIPRLTSRWRWWCLAAALLAVSMEAYALFVVENSRLALGSAFIHARSLMASVGIVSATALDAAVATRGVQATAAILALISGVLATWWPRRGVLLLPVIGLAVTSGLIADLLRANHAGVPLWPVVLGALCFFYLWWLATLIFDLVFVWHRYIRHAAALASMVSLSTKGYEAPKYAKAISKAREMLSKPASGPRSTAAPKESH